MKLRLRSWGAEFLKRGGIYRTGAKLIVKKSKGRAEDVSLLSFCIVNKVTTSL